jgi:hypothetical protein
MKKHIMDQEMMQKIREISGELVSVFEKHETDVITACAILGGVTAHFAFQSEDPGAYLSFFQSFSHTVDAIHASQQKEKKVKPSK